MKTPSPSTPLESPQQENAALIGLPQWMRDALAYKPEQPAIELSESAKPVASEAGDRRNIRILSRIVKT